MPQPITDPVLAGLSIPPRRPPSDRPVPGCAVRILHSGCRLVQTHEFGPWGSPTWHFSWIDRPALTLTWHGGSARQHPGVIALLPPGVRVQRQASASCVHLYLNAQLASRLVVVAPILHPVGNAECALLRQLAIPLAARTAPTPAEGLAMQTLIGLILTTLPVTAWSTLPADLRIRAALATITADPAGAPGNAELAAAVGLSPGRFLRLFRAQVGCAPQRLRLDLRLDAAAAALSDGASVKAVAARFGWRGRNRFSIAFHRRFGAGPATWRRRLGQ